MTLEGARAGRLLLGRLAGIPVYLHYSWLIVFALLTWSLAQGYFPVRPAGSPALANWARALAAALLFFASILLHELGHAVVARRRGLAVRSVTLFVFGGIARLEKEPHDRGTEIRMAAAGPAVTLALVLLFRLVALWTALPLSARVVAEYLAVANLVILLFNLVPAFPLDGARLLRGLLWGWTGRERATRIAAGAGRAFAGLLIVAGVVAVLGGAAVAGFWYVLIGWFLEKASSAASAQARVEERLGTLRVCDVMVREPITVRADMPLVEAIEGCVLSNGFGGYPVVRAGRPVGLLCLRDVIRVPADQRAQASVQALMVPLTDQIAIAPDRPLLEALEEMAERGATRLLVTEEDRLLGLLTLSAVLRQLRAREQLWEPPRAA